MPTATNETTNPRQSMNVIRRYDEDGGPAVIEDDGDFFTVHLSADWDQVQSLGADNPRGGNGSERWIGKFSRAGLDYVSRPRTRAAAMAAYRRAVAAL
jgi:hypothetical protein